MVIPIEEIRREIPPEKYGLREWLIEDLYVTSSDDICVKKQAKSLKVGYDCFDAALKVKEILRRDGLKSDIYSGIDEMGLWETHYFVITDNKHKVDGIPLYKTVDAQHIPKKKISKKEIEKIQSSIVLDGYVPLRCQLTESTKLLSRIGIRRVSDLDSILLRKYRRIPPLTNVVIELILIEDENPTQACEITASFDERLLYNKLYKSGLLPSNMSIDDINKEFKQLLNDKTVKLSGRTYELKLHSPGFLEPKIINIDKVNPILKEEMNNQKDMDVLASLVERIPFTLYV